MLEPVKIAFGQYMGRYFESIVPTTKPLKAFIERPLHEAIAFAPARMVDAAQEMLALWQKANFSGQPTKGYGKMPAIMCAIAKDYTSTARDFARQLPDMHTVDIGGENQETIAKLRVIAADIRAQVAFFAMDTPTAQALAGQFALFIDHVQNRRFFAHYDFGNVKHMHWPVQIETPEVFASNIAVEAKNLTILTADLTLRAHIPLFEHQKQSKAP